MTQQVPPPDLHPSVKHLLSTYCIGRKLGGGSFGTVGAAATVWPACSAQASMRPGPAAYFMT